MGAVGRILRTFAAVVLIVTLYSCGVYGQSTIVAGKIRVILVDYKTGRPLKGHVVQLGLVDKPETKKTDKDGAAVFDVTQSPPGELWVLLENKDWMCTTANSFKTSEILERGTPANFYADPHLCKASPAKFPDPRPGEIILPIRRLNWWLRIRRVVAEE